MTIWKTVNKFPWLQASDDGRIRRVIIAKNGRKPAELIGSTFKNGYRYIQIGGSAGRLKIGLHVLVCEAFHGPAPTPDHEVAHADGTRQNNCPSNLSWKTPKGNAEDRTKHGNTLRGSQIGTFKLKPEDVIEIRRLKSAGLTGLEIAVQFGLNRNTVNNIAAGKSWRHV